MTVAAQAIDRNLLKQMLIASPHIELSFDEMKKLDAVLLISHQVYVGLLNNELACCWGLVPPSLMSDRAYLWLYSSSLVDENKFLFVRHSQRWVEWALGEYPIIQGYCEPRNIRAIRWIEWMGGKFKRPFGARAEFEIRRENGRSADANCG